MVVFTVGFEFDAHFSSSNLLMKGVLVHRRVHVFNIIYYIHKYIIMCVSA